MHLVGPGGSGKSTVAKLSAQLCGLSLVQLQVHREDAWVKQQLCQALWDAGYPCLLFCVLLHALLKYPNLCKRTVIHAFAFVLLGRVCMKHKHAREYGQSQTKHEQNISARKYGLDVSRQAWVKAHQQTRCESMHVAHTICTVTGQCEDWFT